MAGRVTRLVRWLVWATDTDDGKGRGDPSLSKGLAFAFGVLTLVSVVSGLPVSGTQLGLAVVSLSAAFGRSVWVRYLGRFSQQNVALDVTQPPHPGMDRNERGDDDA